MFLRRQILRILGFCPIDFESDSESFLSYERNLLVGLATYIAMWLVFIGVVLSAWSDHSSSFCGTSMFQRSGAVMVGISLMVEIKCSINRFSFPMGSYCGPDGCMFDATSFLERCRWFSDHATKLGLFFTLIGTLI